MMRLFLFVSCLLFLNACSSDSKRPTTDKKASVANPADKMFESYNKAYEVIVPEGWDVYEKPKRASSYLVGPKPQSNSDIRSKADISFRRPNTFFNQKTQETEYREADFEVYAKTYFDATRKIEGYKEIGENAIELNNGKVAVLDFTYTHPKTSEVVRENLYIYDSTYRLYQLRFSCLQDEFFRHEEDFKKIAAGFKIFFPNDPTL